MTHIIDRTTINLTGHTPKSDMLPEFEWNLEGCEVDRIRASVPNAPRPYESVDSSGLEVVIVRHNRNLEA